MQWRVDFDWRQVPFFRLLLALLLGYQLSAWWWWPAYLSVLLIGLLMAVQWLFGRSAWRASYRWRWLQGSLLFMAVALAGATHKAQYSAQRQALELAALKTYPALELTVSHYPEDKGRYIRVQANISGALALDSFWPLQQQGCLLKFDSLDLAAHQLAPGYRLVVSSNQLREIYESRNPHAFSYKKLMASRGIYFQLKLPPEQWRLYRDAEQRGLLSIALRLKKLSTEKLFSYLKGTHQAPFAAALLLGDRSALDQDLVKAYASSGAIHVLAVSGLHVGIFYMLMRWLSINLFRLKRWGSLTMVLSALWLYALVTGLPPSVSRACTMFSLIAIARELKRDALIYNTMSAAAFVLLWFKPGFLAETGFQLSFAAVIGIVYLQPKLYKMLYFKHKWADWLWQLTSVSLAAQLFTFPLSVYYFNQFPNYFLLSNFVVIPIAAPLLLGCLLLLALSPLPFLAEKFAWLLGKGFDLVNAIILQIEQLPGALTEGIVWSTSTFWLSYAFILCVCWWVWGQQLRFRQLAIWLAVTLLVQPLIRKIDQQKQASFTLYDGFNGSSGSFISGKKAWLWGTQPEMPFSPAKNQLMHAGVSAYDTLAVQTIQLLQWQGQRILWVNGKTPPPSWPKADVLLLSNQPPFYLVERQLTKYRTILLDSSNSPYYCEKLKAKVLAAGLRYFSVAEQGALVFTPWTINTSTYNSTNASDTLCSTVPKNAMPSIMSLSPS
ncbi:MAG: ComEC/Rec2 family competence protein [Sphingobacteriaceae bacterium]|nr:ComEC/Rec2 family competence protein [Sphingobacteriaceae bacterium]